MKRLADRARAKKVEKKKISGHRGEGEPRRSAVSRDVGERGGNLKGTKELPLTSRRMKSLLAGIGRPLSEDPQTRNRV